MRRRRREGDRERWGKEEAGGKEGGREGGKEGRRETLQFNPRSWILQDRQWASENISSIEETQYEAKKCDRK